MRVKYFATLAAGLMLGLGLISGCSQPEENKPADAPKGEMKPGEAPKGEMKPGEAPKGEMKPGDATKTTPAKPDATKPAPKTETKPDAKK